MSPMGGTRTYVGRNGSTTADAVAGAVDCCVHVRRPALIADGGLTAKSY